MMIMTYFTLLDDDDDDNGYLRCLMMTIMTVFYAA